MPAQYICCRPVSVCLFNCLSQASIVLKQLDESSWLFAWRLPSTYPILIHLKIRVLLSGTLSQTPDLENFTMASRPRRQQNWLSTVELVGNTYMTIDELWLFATSGSTF